jgi:hypothetical protein
MMEMLDRALIDLTVFNRIKVGDKIYQNSEKRLCIMEPTILNNVWRTFQGHNRSQTITLLTNLFQEAIVLLNHVKPKSEYGNIHKRLTTELQKSIITLRTLKSTYITNTNITSHLDCLRDKLSDAVLPIHDDDQMFYSQLCILSIET